MSTLSMFRRPATIALALTASIAIVSCGDNKAPTSTVTNVAVTAPKTTLAVKETTQAKAVVTGTNTPAQTVKWTTSDAKIATVSTTGLITAVAPGNAVVSANSTVSGFTSKSGSVNIKVTGVVTNPPTVSGVTVALNPATVAVGGTSQATATVTGTNNSQKVEFSSSNESVATVDDNGKITAKAVGTTTITAKSDDDNTKSGVATLTVTAAGTGGALTTAKINFGTSDSDADVDGYTRNTGAAYDAASMTGWVTEDSAGTAMPKPLNLTDNARNYIDGDADVTAGLAKAQYSQINMQCGTATDGNNCFKGDRTSGAFELKVVNGKYNVKISAGDAFKKNVNSVYNLNAEGVNVISNFTPSASNGFKVNTVQVTVADGKLTIDAKGGKNTKINYLEVTPAN